MPDGLFALSTNPANFGIDQPPDQGAQEVEQALSQINRQNAPNPLDQLRDMGSRLGAQSKMQELGETPPFGSIKFNSDGTIDASKIPAETVKDLFQARDFQRQTLGGFAQQAAQLEQQLQRAQSQPWQQLATALAANMASQKDMPGWVRGMGQTAAQMNPSVDQLRARYLATMGQGAEIAKGVRAEDIAEGRTKEDRLQREQAIAAREAEKALALENQREDDFGKYIEKEAARAEKSRTFDESTVQRISSLARQFGRDDARVASAVDAVRASAEGGKAAYAEEIAKQKAEQEQRAKDRQALVAATQGGMNERFKQLRDETLTQQEVARYTQNTSPPMGAEDAIRSAIKTSQMAADMKVAFTKVNPGPITGRAALANPWRPEEVQELKFLANNLILSGVGGSLGTGISNRDLEFITEIVPNQKMTPEQAKASLNLFNQLNKDSLSKFMRMYPNRELWESMRPEFEDLDSRGLKAGEKSKGDWVSFFDQRLEQINKHTEKKYPLLFDPTQQTRTAARRLGAAKEKAAPAKPKDKLDELLDKAGF